MADKTVAQAPCRKHGSSRLSAHVACSAIRRCYGNAGDHILLLPSLPQMAAIRRSMFPRHRDLVDHGIPRRCSARLRAPISGRSHDISYRYGRAGRCCTALAVLSANDAHAGIWCGPWSHRPCPAWSWIGPVSGRQPAPSRPRSSARARRDLFSGAASGAHALIMIACRPHRASRRYFGGALDHYFRLASEFAFDRYSVLRGDSGAILLSCSAGRNPSLDADPARPLANSQPISPRDRRFTRFRPPTVSLIIGGLSIFDVFAPAPRVPDTR